MLISGGKELYPFCLALACSHVHSSTFRSWPVPFDTRSEANKGSGELLGKAGVTQRNWEGAVAKSNFNCWLYGAEDLTEGNTPTAIGVFADFSLKEGYAPAGTSSAHLACITAPQKEHSSPFPQTGGRSAGRPAVGGRGS